MRPEPWVEWVRGLCSGFPRCCVEWYMEVYLPRCGDLRGKWWPDDPEMRVHLARARAIGGIGYIPCPACLDAHRFVAHHSGCRSDCAQLVPMPEYDACPNQ